MGGIRSIFRRTVSESDKAETSTASSDPQKFFERSAAIEVLKRYYNVQFKEYYHLDLPATNAEDSWVDLSYQSSWNAEKQKLDKYVIENLNSHPILVVGQGGFGKSILTKRIASTYAKGELTKYYDLLLCVSGEEIKKTEEVPMEVDSKEAEEPRDDILLSLQVLQAIKDSLKATPRHLIKFSHAKQTSKWLQEQNTKFCPASEEKERTLVIIDGWNYLGEHSLWRKHLLPLLRYPEQISYDLLVTTQPIACIGSLPDKLAQIELNGFSELQCQQFVADYTSKMKNVQDRTIARNLIQHAFEQDGTIQKLYQSPMYLNYLCFSAKHNRFSLENDKWTILEVLYKEILKDTKCQLSRDCIDGHAKSVLRSPPVIRLGRIALDCFGSQSGFEAKKPIIADEYNVFEEWPQCHNLGILHKQFSNGLIECWFPTSEAQVFFAKNVLPNQNNVNEKLRSIPRDSSKCLEKYFQVLINLFKESESIAPQVNRNNSVTERTIKEQIRGVKAVSILRSHVVCTKFKLVDAAELAPLLSPWFIRRNEKEQILAFQLTGNKAGAADKLFDIIVGHFEQERQDICLQDLIEKLEDTEKYQNLISALVNGCM